MSILHSSETQSLIDRIIREGGSIGSTDAEQFNHFVRHYYYAVPYDSLSERSLHNLKNAALTHYELGTMRGESEFKLRIFNPDVEADGWRCKYTVLDVVSRDRPFLVDSVNMVLNKLGLKVHLVVHPVFVSRRDDQGRLDRIAAPHMADFLDGVHESYLHCQFDRPASAAEVERLRAALTETFALIDAAVEDWPKLRAKAKRTCDNLQGCQSESEDLDSVDDAEFFKWIATGNFALLGYCEFTVSKSKIKSLDQDSLLGILRNADCLENIIPDIQAGASIPGKSVLINKANILSPIHRASYLDMIKAHKYSSAGNCIALRVFLGLFSSTAYNKSAAAIPIIRNKIKRVLQRSRFSETTHSIRALTNIMDNYPRDLLFRVAVDELFEDVAGILELQERNRIKVLLRSEQYGRYFSAIVYIPQEIFSRNLRVRIEQILMESLGGVSSEFFATFSGSVLARITYTIQVEKSSVTKRSLAEIQHLVEDAAVTWTDSLYRATIERYGDVRGAAYFKIYESAFSVAYQEAHSPYIAAADLERFAALGPDNRLIVSFFRPVAGTSEDEMRLRLYCYEQQISPSDALPYMENSGLRVLAEVPYRVYASGQRALWVHDFVVAPVHAVELDAERQRANFEESFTRIWNGEAENDSFNRLILSANLSWRQVVVLRAYSRYLKQIGNPFSESYVTETLLNNVGMTVKLIEYFELMFDPAAKATAKQRNLLLTQMEGMLDSVSSLDEDTILRRCLNAISSTLRTNYYKDDAQGKPLSYMSFKIDAAKILNMPEPRPQYEIFVYSTRTEAVHLRGGKVARGGLRWSDRREDFRTEVLGLVKAQMVKNAVIVPVGSKGGFVCKQSPPDGSSAQDEAIYCYQTFIRGMLDITDNIIGANIVPPERVVRYDEDDPYLVVAADKGTATFSDIANALSQEYAFWLGDAFASGGSIGYDHKGMGITARGAWESVKRHFREQGADIQTEDFTVIGIGDMSGDVFGNGMLLSQHIRLVGAFNHIEIFLDPNPDAAVSWEERKRLFDLAGLTWKDYDRNLISKGGGVYERSAKAIEISPEVRKRLKISAKRLTPNELINAMLKAPIDLLWNGGIGTYVKSSLQSHAEAENRANDAIRVNGSELGCKVVGEGGNLGMTQLGRIEFCMHGGRCYTDFIDNSGGVDCSDHEVNIKILLNQIVANGEMTAKQRQKILADMADEVSDLVLTDNYQQSQALSLTQVDARNLFREHMQFIRSLESSGDLDRRIEFLPDRDEIRRREAEGIGLKLPELSVIFAYSKMTLYRDLLDSDVPEDGFLMQELNRYFPQRLGKKYANEILNHRLRREIIATLVTNDLVNRAGITFTMRMRQFTGAANTDITRAYCAAREIFSLNALWTEVEALDNQVPASVQLTMLAYINGLLERATLWLLRHRSPSLDIKETVRFYKKEIEQLSGCVSDVLDDYYRGIINEHVSALIADKVPEKLAQRIANEIALSTAFDIVEIIKSTGKPAKFVAQVYFDIGHRLELMWIRQKVSMLPVENHWHHLAKSRLSDDIHSHQFVIASDVVREASVDVPVQAVRDWMERNSNGCRVLANLVSDMRSLPKIDFATLSVAISEVYLLSRVSDN